MRFLSKLTPAANRAARGILQWSVRKLAEEAGLAFSTVHQFEKTGRGSDKTCAKIMQAFERENVEIVNGEGTGARLRDG